MDLGATICIARVPRCGECPLAAECPSRGRRFEPLRKQGPFEGSFRQRRARTLRLVAESSRLLGELDAEAVAVTRATSSSRSRTSWSDFPPSETGAASRRRARRRGPRPARGRSRPGPGRAAPRSCPDSGNVIPAHSSHSATVPGDPHRLRSGSHDLGAEPLVRAEPRVEQEAVLAPPRGVALDRRQRVALLERRPHRGDQLPAALGREAAHVLEHPLREALSLVPHADQDRERAEPVGLSLAEAVREGVAPAARHPGDRDRVAFGEDLVPVHQRELELRALRVEPRPELVRDRVVEEELGPRLAQTPGTRAARGSRR